MQTLKKLMNIKELMEYLACGRNKAREIGIKANAVVKIGRKNVYRVESIDEYVDSHLKLL